MYVVMLFYFKIVFFPRGQKVKPYLHYLHIRLLTFLLLLLQLSQTKKLDKNKAFNNGKPYVGQQPSRIKTTKQSKKGRN